MKTIRRPVKTRKIICILVNYRYLKIPIKMSNGVYGLAPSTYKEKATRRADRIRKYRVETIANESK